MFCLLFPKHYHSPAVKLPLQERHRTQSNSRDRRYKITLAEMQMQNPLFFSITKAQSYSPCPARHLGWPQASKQGVHQQHLPSDWKSKETFLHRSIWPRACTSRMPDTCQKLKTNKKTTQGETDSLTVSLTWEGEAHHQQCTCSIKCGCQEEYSATLLKLTNICFTTSNLESSSGSCN